MTTKPEIFYIPREVRHADRAKFFKGCIYLTDLNNVYCSDGVIRGRAKFNGMYGDRRYFDSAGKVIPTPWLAFVHARDFRRPQTANLESLYDEFEARLWTETKAGRELDAIETQLAQLRRKLDGA